MHEENYKTMNLSHLLNLLAECRDFCELNEKSFAASMIDIAIEDLCQEKSVAA